MAKAKKGDHLSCKVCGLVLVVDKACGCATAEILCCKKPMAKGKPAAKKKPAAKAVAAPAKVNAKKSAKPAAKTGRAAKKKPARAKK